MDYFRPNLDQCYFLEPSVFLSVSSNTSYAFSFSIQILYKLICFYGYISHRQQVCWFFRNKSIKPIRKLSGRLTKTKMILIINHYNIICIYHRTLSLCLSIYTTFPSLTAKFIYLSEFLCTQDQLLSKNSLA